MKFINYLIFTTLIGLSPLVSANPNTSLSALLDNREQNFSAFVEQTLEPFWLESVKPLSFTNSQGLTIHYAIAIPEQATQLIVVSPGRVEGYLKYKELVYDLVQLGFAVAVIDHQGQGLSSRRLDNPHKGYVEHFDDYVADLEQMIQQEIKPRFDGELLFLSHSMGGAIGLRYLETHPETFTKAVFSSPMWGLEAGPLPKSLAKGLVSSVTWATSLWSDQASYFFGGQDYTPPSFADNVLTSSQPRYQLFRDTYAKEPSLQLGSITFNWLDQSVKALDLALTELNKVKADLLVLQAGNDKVIDNAGQVLFCEELNRLGNPCHGVTPRVIAGAEHELFIERDELRNQALTAIVGFFQGAE